jgi:uncharacterized protein YdcH (DUF465 family)
LFSFLFFKEVHQQQNDEIRRLQHEITRLREEHVNGMSQMKLHFEREIQQQRTNENAKVEGIRRQANQVLIDFFFYLIFIFLQIKIKLGCRTISL